MRVEGFLGLSREAENYINHLFLSGRGLFIAEILVPNKPGQLAKALFAFAKRGLNLLAIVAYGELGSEYARAFLVYDGDVDEGVFLSALNEVRDYGCVVSMASRVSSRKVI